MVDASSARPRPRPRPKPVAKPVAAPSNAGSSNVVGDSSPPSESSSTPLNATRPPRVIEVEDTDEMFMRNRNRSSKTWQKLEQINKETSKPGKDDSSESGYETTPRKYKRSKKDSNTLPAWQKHKDLTRLLSQDLSDGSDDDAVEITSDSYTPNGKRNGKRKRQRSRSRSITPPPALPAHQIQNAKNIIRQTLQAAVRSTSPTIIDLEDEDIDTTEDLDLQPEFMLMAQQIRDKSRRGSSQAPEAAGAGDEILVTVKWQPHPLAANGAKVEWQYKIDRSDNFRDLFEAVAEDASVFNNNLILTYQGKRVFSSVTPQTLRIWTDTAELLAYEKTSYEYVQKNLVSKSTLTQTSTSNTSTSNGTIDIDSDSEGGASDGHPSSPPPETQTQTQESDSEAEVENGDKFKLILRSALTGTNNITLTVRSTTKCGAIIRAFLKKAGVADQYPEMFGEGAGTASVGKSGKGGKKAAAASKAGSGKDPRLCIDGDKMDNEMEIGDQDLEDGDMVEVVGL